MPAPKRMQQAISKNVSRLSARSVCRINRVAMRELMKGGAFLLFISFLLALIQSCSMDNSIIKPACFIYEIDLDEKWWYPQDKPEESPLYFQANGLLKIEGQADSITFRIENCNKLRITNLATHSQELWTIKAVTGAVLYIQYPVKGLVTYSRNR